MTLKCKFLFLFWKKTKTLATFWARFALKQLDHWVLEEIMLFRFDLMQLAWPKYLGCDIVDTYLHALSAGWHYKTKQPAFPSTWKWNAKWSINQSIIIIVLPLVFTFDTVTICLVCLMIISFYYCHYMGWNLVVVMTHLSVQSLCRKAYIVMNASLLGLKADFCLSSMLPFRTACLYLIESSMCLSIGIYWLEDTKARYFYLL
jgi:hypothetical protein